MKGVVDIMAVRKGLKMKPREKRGIHTMHKWVIIGYKISCGVL